MPTSIKQNVIYNVKGNNFEFSVEAPDGLSSSELLAYTIPIASQDISDSEWDNVVVIQKQAVMNYKMIQNWAKTGTAADAEIYINGQIFGGQTQTQVEAYIDAAIKNIQIANVAQINEQLGNIRAVFKAAAGAVITMRGLFILVAKLLIHIRDLVIRFRS